MPKEEEDDDEEADAVLDIFAANDDDEADEDVGVAIISSLTCADRRLLICRCCRLPPVQNIPYITGIILVLQTIV